MKNKTLSSRNHNRRTQIKFPKTGMTKQMHKQECDINFIMQKFQKTGVLDHLNKYKSTYGFCTSTDLHESLNIINTAQEMFDDLPSKARNKFENDPGQFLDFVQDPENKEKLFDLGLTDYCISPIIEAETPKPAESTPTPAE